jgi:argininosuccinate synthase
VSSQQRVTGEVKVMYRPGMAFIEGVTSKYSIMAASKGVYGEAAGEWTAADALGFRGAGVTQVRIEKVDRTVTL